jgi:uncharacterized membrane protein
LEFAMTVLVVGLVLFLGIHLLPAAPPLRNAVSERLGPSGYKGAFTLLSLAGIVLIVVGYRAAGPGAQLFAPSPAAIAIAPYAMVLSFILFAAANMRTHLRRMVRHPMLAGVLVWAAIHLCANGDTRGTVLFGAFVAWALVDLASAVSRKAVKEFEPVARQDAMAIGGGVLVALVVMVLHRALFGVAAVPFGA